MNSLLERLSKLAAKTGRTKSDGYKPKKSDLRRADALHDDLAALFDDDKVEGALLMAVVDGDGEVHTSIVGNCKPMVLHYLGHAFAEDQEESTIAALTSGIEHQREIEEEGEDGHTKH